MRHNIHQTLSIRTVNERPDGLTRDSSSERPLPADLGGLRSQQAACSLCCACGIHAGSWRLLDCSWKAAGGGTSVRYHRDRAIPTTTAAPEWPPRASVWHETRTRAAGMYAEYVWPCYVAQLPLCPRVTDWVCLRPHALQTARKSLCYADQSAGGVRWRRRSSTRAAPFARFAPAPQMECEHLSKIGLGN